MQSTLWDKLTSDDRVYSDLAYPKVSIVIATHNSAMRIPETLDSIFMQDYSDIEVIIVDGRSTDRTIEVIQEYGRKNIQVYSFRGWRRYEMLNMGVLHAKGSYVNFLFPGDYYLHKRVLRQMMRLALDSEKPDLVYSACLIHERSGGTRVLYRPLTLDILRKGRQPTSLQSCWFRLDVFKKIGRFHPNYELRGGYDIMCRFCLTRNLTSSSLWRVTSDYHPLPITRRSIFYHFWETTRTLFTCFGWWSTFKWMVKQRDLSRLLKSWLNSLRVAFTGR